MNLLIICLLVTTVVCHEIFTRTQLRGLYKQQLYKSFDAEIQTIVKRVISISQENQTSYSYSYPTMNGVMGYNGVLQKFQDETIIAHLQNVLVDSNITMVGPKCCSDDPNWCSRKYAVSCKYIIIEW
jgi:hypothetical protein